MAGHSSLHCVSDRCRLCQFLFQSEDRVIADVDGRLSSEFSFGRNYIDDGLKVLLRPCFPGCMWYGRHTSGRIPGYYAGRVLGYHAECLALTSLPSGAFLRATEYSFEPDISEEERRRAWTLALLADRMSKMHLRLPMELRLLVARNLIHECAIVASQQAWHARCSRDCDVDISLEIWTDYAYIEGLQYISCVSNQASQTSTARRIRSAESPPAAVLHVLEDHLGIRELVFSATEESRPSMRPGRGLWWRTVPLVSGRVKMESDGLKLRRVMSTAAVSTKLWRLPMTPHELRDLSFFNYAPKSGPKLNGFRMVPLDLNAPDVVGYSACWSGKLVMLHAHKAGEDLAFYKDLLAAYDHSAWIYIPMSSGERILEIWGRRGKLDGHMGLLIKTNKAKQTVIGLSISTDLLLRNGGIHPAWTQLCAFPEGPSRLFLSHSRLGVHLLGTKDVGNPNATFSIPTPMSCPKRHGIIEYFYSAASLEDVVEVTPCEIKLATYSRISGLIFQYANGERACVGEIRLDCLGEPLLVQPKNRLHLAFKRDRFVGPHATRFWLDNTLDDGSPEWFSLPWTGVLEWWFCYGRFSYGHCRVYHQGRESPLFYN